MEVWKFLAEIEVIWLARLFNKILMTKMMTDEWRKSVAVPIYLKTNLVLCQGGQRWKLSSHPGINGIISTKKEKSVYGHYRLRKSI